MQEHRSSRNYHGFLSPRALVHCGFHVCACDLFAQACDKQQLFSRSHHFGRGPAYFQLPNPQSSF